MVDKSEEQKQTNQNEEIKLTQEEQIKQLLKKDPSTLSEQELKEYNRAKANMAQQSMGTLGKKQSTMKEHAFWNNQPVPQNEEEIEFSQNSGPIEQKTIKDISKEPYPLPQGFQWCDVDLNDENQLNEVYELLRGNYVEDDDAMFRFDYSKEFIKWALHPPGYKPNWLVGVRWGQKNHLVAFITGVPVKIRLEKSEQITKMSEINFLCVRSDIRKKRLAALLIKEVTRRCNVKKIWQAVYTAGIQVPTPFSQARYFHRSLNPKKLIEVGFTGLGKNQTIPILQKLYSLPKQTNIDGLREMQKKDVKQVTELLNEYLSKFNLQIVFHEEEIKHFLLPRQNVIFSYVVEKDGKVTDFLSFYQLCSSILKHPTHKTLYSAYSYYNVAKTISFTKLMENALIIAKKNGFDVFNKLNLMENEQCFQELQFSPGDGFLHYYLYNWKTSHVFKASELGMVLV